MEPSRGYDAAVSTFRVAAVASLALFAALVPAAFGLGFVTIDDGPKKQTKKRSATFAFSSDDPSALFECRLDSARFEACSSPLELKGLQRGRHAFQVRAVGLDGSVSAPASLKWKVLEKGRR